MGENNTVMIKYFLITLVLLCGCQTKNVVYLNELATIKDQNNKEWWIKYNTNALRIIGVSPLWDAELGLRDDGVVVWRKIQPLK